MKYSLFESGSCWLESYKKTFKFEFMICIFLYFCDLTNMRFDVIRIMLIGITFKERGARWKLQIS